MKTRILLILLGLGFQLSAQDLQFQWVKNVLNPTRMVADQNDNVYISGPYSGAISFHGINLTFASTDGDYNSFFAKLDSSGNVLWYRQLAGTQMENITDLNVDSDGNLIISAMFVDRVLIDGDTLIGTHSHNTLLMKYLANGDLDWYKVPVTIDAGCVHLYKTVLDTDNNIYFTGTGSQYNMHFDTTILHGDSTYGYIAKYSPNGVFMWVRGMNSLVSQMDVGPTGNIVFYRNDSLIKFSTTGNEMWAQPVPYYLNHVDDHTLLVIDPFDNIYAAGSFYSTITLGTDSFIPDGTRSDIIVEKLDANGSHLWGFQCGGPDSDVPSMLCVNEDRVVLAGDFKGKICFENDSITSPWTFSYYYPNTCIIGLNLSGIRVFDNSIIARKYSNNALITMNDAIYVSVLAADSVFFDGEVFYPDTGYYPNFLAKLHGTAAGIEQIGSGIALYPNPASDYIEISCTMVGQGIYAEIININGQVLKKVEIKNSTEKLDVQFLEPGIYLLKMSDEKNSIVQKFLKM